MSIKKHWIVLGGLLLLSGVLFLAFSFSELGPPSPPPVPVRAGEVEDSISAERIRELIAAAFPAGIQVAGAKVPFTITHEGSEQAADFPFNALGLRWERNLPEGAGLKLQVRYKNEEGDWSSWEEAWENNYDVKDKGDPPGAHFSHLISVGQATVFQYRAVFTLRDVQNLPSAKVRATYIDSKTGIRGKKQPLGAVLQAALIALRQRLDLGGRQASAHSPSADISITNRAGWGADESLRFNAQGGEIWTREYVPIKKIVVHHTVSNDPNPKVIIRAIYYYHAVTRGWGDIGYNFLIDRNGRIYEGRYGGDSVVGGHALSYNYGSVGVAVLGDFRFDSLNNPIKNALQKVAVWKLTKHGVDPTVKSHFVDRNLPAVFGHGLVRPTECPGINLKNDMDALRSRTRFTPQEVLVTFKGGVSDGQMASFASKLKLTRLSSHFGRIRRFWFGNDRLSRQIISAARKEGIVKLAQVNWIRQVTLTPNDPQFSSQWSLPQIKVPDAWDVTPGGSSTVTAAVLDTGVAYESYSDTKGTYAKATDLSAANFVAGYDFVNSDTHPNDDHGHGTAVTSVLAAATDNGVGISGIAYAAKIMPVKVLDKNGAGTDATVSDGIRWAVDHGAKVLNLSLGSTDHSPVLEGAINYAASRGVVVVAAAGNQGRDGLLYPARYPSVVAVGASDLNGNRTSYSNYGSQLDLLAPGGNLNADLDGNGTKDGILSETLDTAGSDFTKFKFALGQGTSLAAAHASGVLALLTSLSGNVGAVELGDTLARTASSGLVNALASVNNPPVTTTPLGVVKLDGGDPNFYLYNTPRKAERRGVIAADYWSVPDHNVVAVSGFKDGSNRRIGVIRYKSTPTGRDYNFFLYALNENGVAGSSLVAADYWNIPDNGVPVDIAGVDVDGDGVDEVVVLKKERKSWGTDFNLYIYRLPRGTMAASRVGADYWSAPDGGSYLITGVGDVDGDGKGDLGVMKREWRPTGADHNFYIYKMLLGTQYSPRIGANYWDLADRGVNVDMAGVGDINGDGKMDLAIMKKEKTYRLYVYPLVSGTSSTRFFGLDSQEIPRGNNTKFISGIIK